MRVVQCWDDGVTNDLKLIEVLRRYEAKATFNLSPGLYDAKRRPAWSYQGCQLFYLGWEEMLDAYDGFVIANHTLRHPRLSQLSPDGMRQEIADGRARLQDYFNQPVDGFAYPFGDYNTAVMEAVRAAGHAYGRTTQRAGHAFPPAEPMAFHPTCHVLDQEFWSRYEQSKAGRVFYFWGHSYEFTDEAMWSAFEAIIARISSDPDTVWGQVADLFKDDDPRVDRVKA